MSLRDELISLLVSIPIEEREAVDKHVMPWLKQKLREREAETIKRCAALLHLEAERMGHLEGEVK